MIRRAGRVDGDREAQTAPGDGGVDADDGAAGIGKRAAGVAGVEGGVGLMTFSISAAVAGRSDRPRAPTTPAVTVPARPSGLPTATTS